MMIKIDNKEFSIGEVYQPIYGTDIKSERVCYDRLRTILTADWAFNNGNLLRSSITDIGCCVAWFLLKLSEQTHKTMIGIERNKNYCEIAKHLVKKHNRINIKIINDSFENTNVNSEAYLFLSILHHYTKDARFNDNIILKKIKPNIMYVEQATHLEPHYFGMNLLIKDNPFTYWRDELNRITDNNYNTRLIGIHRTHLNTVRPMYQLKRKISEELKINGEIYEVYDKWNTPYMEFGLPRIQTLNINNPIIKKTHKTYRYATFNNGDWFIKSEDNKHRVYKKHEGFLLSEILRYGMINFYDRQKIRKQFLDYKNKHIGHNDAQPWNFIIDNESNVMPIDYDDNESLLGKNSFKYHYDTILNLI